MADRAGITGQHLQRLEYGNSNPKLETLFESAGICDVRVAEMQDL